MSEVTREMTFGERLVGLNFNPSGDDKVGQVKQLFAQIADIVDQQPEYPGDYLRCLLKDHTIGELLNAQMNVVKLLTLK